MTIAALPFWVSLLSRTKGADSAARTDPPLQPGPGPVLIHDAITPWRGETLLSSRLKADIDRALAEDADKG